MSSVHETHELTEVLNHEHVLILEALELFERFAEQVCSGAAFEPRVARDFLRFFREFADADHHHKEEEILFPWLEEQGLPHEVGPLAVLRAEHELGRETRLSLALALDDLAGDPVELDPRLRFHALAQRFTELMRAHIEKEEHVLLPLARRFAEQLDEVPVVSHGVRAAVREQLAGFESEARSWPAARRVGHLHGTPYAFERLCEEAMA